MSDYLYKVKDLTKKKILSIIPSNLELYGELYMVKLYSCDKDGRNWLFSDVEGFCCLLINESSKLIYLAIFDPFTYEKLFQYELYNNFEKYLENLAPDFRSFEIDSGFMGIRFETEEDAIGFETVIKRLSAFKDDLFGKKNIKEDSQKQKNDKLNTYYQILKKKFVNENNKYDETYSEDGTTILKHNNLKSLLNVSCDLETKKFTFGKISEELKDIFFSLGIKKKDLESDSQLAYTIVKKVLVCLGSKTELKNSVVDQIQHVFPPPEEREKLRKLEEAEEAKMYNIKKRRQTNKKGASKQGHKGKSKQVQIKNNPVNASSKPVVKPPSQKENPPIEAPKPKPPLEKSKTNAQSVSQKSQLVSKISQPISQPVPQKSQPISQKSQNIPSKSKIVSQKSQPISQKPKPNPQKTQPSTTKTNVKKEKSSIPQPPSAPSPPPPPPPPSFPSEQEKEKVEVKNSEESSQSPSLIINMKAKESSVPPPAPSTVPPPPPPPTFEFISNPQPKPETKPKTSPTVSKLKNEEEEDNDNSGLTTMEKEILKVKLKKVEKKEIPAGFDRMMQGDDRNFLQNALSTALKIRRTNIHLHDEENEDDEEDDDW